VLRRKRRGFHVGKGEDKMGHTGFVNVTSSFLTTCHSGPTASWEKKEKGLRFAMMELDGGRIGIGYWPLG